jgi:two-component system, sensor histidine kinase LadS
MANIVKKIAYLLSTSLYLLGLSQIAYSSEQIILSSDKIDLLQNADIYEDTSGSKSAVEVMALNNFKSFRDNGKHTFGFTKSAIWFKVTLKNQSNSSNFNIASERTGHREFVIYDITDGPPKVVTTTGLKTHIKDRPYHSRLFYGEVELSNQSNSSFLIKVTSDMTIASNLYLMGERERARLEQKLESTHFFYFGAMGILLATSFLLFLTLREWDYLIYVAFGATFSYTIFIYGGYPEYFDLAPKWLPYSGDIPEFILVPNIIALFYARSFLQTATISKRLDRSLIATITVGTISYLYLAMWGDTAGFRYMRIFQLLTLVMIISAGITASRRGNKPAQIFLAAWGCFCLSIILWMCAELNIIQKTYLIAFAPLYGSLAEMTLMSFALGYKYKDLQRKAHQSELNETKSTHLTALIRLVCHDIANPLAIIVGSIDIGKRQPQSEKMQRNLERADRASNIITSIISNVRELEAIDSGKNDVDLKPVSLAKVWDEIGFLFSAKAQAKQVTLSIDSVNEDIYVLGEQTALTNEVFANLVSNAIKFTKPGGVVKLSCEVMKKKILISIKDNGIGMPKNIRDNIFSSSVRTTRAGTNKEKGTGFGMPLTKKYIDIFEGSIDVSTNEVTENRNGPTGTCFTVELKRAYENKAAA